MKKTLIIIAGCSLIAAGCYNDKSDKLYPVPVVTPGTVTCDTTTVTYNADIKPIITAYCNISGGCHDVAGATTSGYDFTQFAILQNTATLTAKPAYGRCKMGERPQPYAQGPGKTIGLRHKQAGPLGEPGRAGKLMK